MKYCMKCGNSVSRRRLAGDSRERFICDSCGEIHYQNPKIVVGCVPEQDGRILLCRRAIEPRRGFWTVPAGFMELGETLAEGAARETREEACAEVEIGRLFASVDVIEAGQVHIFFAAKLIGGYGVGEETLETVLFAKDEIPWTKIAFRSGTYALEKYLDDAGRDNGVHLHRVPHGE
jgi:ADP-ribose pyrophosphatase YjhB (NUDIX family)